MRKLFILLALPFIFAFSQSGTNSTKQTAMKLKARTMLSVVLSTNDIIKALVDKYGEANKFKIEKGVKQCAALWTDKDGDANAFQDFCITNFAKPGDDQKKLFDRLSTNFETLFGCFNKMHLNLKKPLDEDMGETLPVDDLFGSYDPQSHFADDFFANKIAFTVILNFPHFSLKEKEDLGGKWTRLEWAYSKMGDVFTARVPAELEQKYSDALTAADSYISSYNIYMGKIVDDNLKPVFPADLKLITHWGLRDELKSHYADADGLPKMKLIYAVMKDIITQDIPAEVIDKNDYQWNPNSNKLYKDGKEHTATPEKNKRYQYLLDNFKANLAIDKYCPQAPTYIQRKFDGEMQMTQEELEKIFTTFLSSPTVKKVAALISKRLKRKLEPFDIWYDGFKSRSTMSEDDLTKATKAKYPTKEAFAKDLPNILMKVGFTKEKADFIVSQVEVDASRGAGHAWESDMKGDKAHLRTRVGKDGMDYKGYNIAVHEFGHNVEQTITLNDIDYYMLRSVPNTSCTEAVAFMFQQKDLQLLGYKEDETTRKAYFALDNFWSAYEIMGVSLVDMAVWKLMYEHPGLNADQLRTSTIEIAKNVWNRYYADVMGSKDEPILAVYSHMIEDPLYLSAYPIGHLVDFQIEKYMEGKNFATELQRILLSGSITPQQWMKNAVGSEISGQALIDATEEAMKNLKE
jgi:hypothetical protein